MNTILALTHDDSVLSKQLQRRASWCASLIPGVCFLLASSACLLALPPGNWTQTFNDDFSGTSLDSTKWSTGYVWSAIINNELQGMRPENVTVANGVCTIKLEKRDCLNQAFQGQYEWNAGSHYASGCLTTFNKFTQAYGYFEARIQTPTCKGAWPTFWLLPDRGSAYGSAWVDNTGQRSSFNVTGQPLGNEIDVLESFGSWKRADNTARMHDGFFWNYSGGSTGDYGRANGGLGNTLYFPNPDTQWHTYGVYWAPGSYTFYVDDQIVNYWTNSNVAGCPEYMLLNVACSTNDWTGTNLTTAAIDAGLPSVMNIDWVRVYSGTASNPVPFATTWVGRDINNGSPMPSGTDTWNAATCTVNAQGLWGFGDPSGGWGRLTFKSITGDGAIVAKVTRLDDVGSSYASAGLMIRENANFQSTSAYIFNDPTYGGHGMSCRLTTTGTSTSGVWSMGQYLPIWMKLSRTGDVFKGWFSTDGTNWGSPVYTGTIAMNPTVQIGLATSSRSNSVTTAVYENVSITGTGPTSLVIANSSFESGNLSGWNTLASGGYGSGAWVTNNVTNQSSQYPTFTNPLRGTASGTCYAGLEGYEGNGPEAIYQDISANGLGNPQLQPNTTYTLTVAVGVGAHDFAINDGRIALISGTSPTTGTVLATGTVSSLGFAPYANNFKDLSVTFTTGSSVSGDLTIELYTTHGYPSYYAIQFDNVRLTKSP